MDFSVTPSTFEENLDKASFEHPKDYVKITGWLVDSKQELLKQMFYGSSNCYLNQTIFQLVYHFLSQPFWFWDTNKSYIWGRLDYLNK